MPLLEKFKAQRVFLRSRGLCSFSSSGQDLIDPVYQIFCDVKGSELPYKVGDSLGVFPKNEPSLVDDVLSFLQYAPSEIIDSPKAASSPLSIRDFLTSYVDLDKIPAKFKQFFPSLEKETTLFDALYEFRPQIPLQEFVHSVLPLLPRFYSIASSPYVLSGEMELLVRLVTYKGKFSQRLGACSSFLCKQLQEGDPLFAFVQPTRHFTLTEKTKGKPIVMIGSGTGISPYKGFVQQRLYQQDSGMNILFFGERYEKSNFYYQNFWQKIIEQDKLQLFSAFSREGEQKEYVQDAVCKQGDLIRALYDQGAFFFVCGRRILGTEIKRVLEEILGKEAFLRLKEEGRYTIDVY